MIRSFELHRPAGLDEAFEMKTAYAQEAAVYAGGTELLLVMKLGLAEYEHLIDLKGLAELRRCELDDGVLHLGAGLTHRAIEHSALVQEHWPALAAMERHVANLRVRSVGTLGGNLCFADPHSDPMTFLLAAGAELRCMGPGGATRVVPASEFVVGLFETALGEDELLLGVDVPLLPAGAALAHEKLSLQERPTASVASYVQTDGHQVIDARVAVGAVGDRPVGSVTAAEQVVGGSIPEAEPTRIAAAAEAAAAAVEPVEDGQGSADYKRNLVRVLTGRTLRAAIASAARRIG